jgi:prevent-host-death family protein
MQVTATEAKNRFGSLCAEAKRAPITILKDGRPDSVIVSFATFQNLSQRQDIKSAEQRKREFQETYKDWIASYNEDIEKNGLWCDGQAAWNAHV